MPWSEVFLQQKLGGVGDRLKQPRRTDPIGSEAVLDQRADSTLCIDGVIHDAEHDGEKRDDFGQGGC
jgi:hypothetical protein